MVCYAAVNLYLWMGIGKQLFIDWHVEVPCMHYLPKPINGNAFFIANLILLDMNPDSQVYS